MVNYKVKACDLMEKELKSCMNQDSIANAFGFLNILSLPAVYAETKCFQHTYGKEDIVVLVEHFGNKHWVIRSFKDEGSENGHIVKPVL